MYIFISCCFPHLAEFYFNSLFLFMHLEMWEKSSFYVVNRVLLPKSKLGQALRPDPVPSFTFILAITDNNNQELYIYPFSY